MLVALRLIMAALFLWAAALQLNDPDTTIWVALYGVLAIASGFAAFRPLPKRLWQSLMILYAVVLLVVVIGVDSWRFSSERAREAGGLLISLGWLWTIAPRR